MTSHVKIFTFNPFQENTYVVSDQQTKKAVIIDPGCFDDHEKNTLKEYIESENLEVEHVLLTHAHIDHIFGLKFVCDVFDKKPLMHQLEHSVLTQMSPMAAKLYNVPLETPPLPKQYFQEGDTITFGESTLKIVFTPGHAPGHVVFVSDTNKFIIGGDVLFKSSIGRTDFPNSNHDDLIQSIQKKLYTLDDDYIVYPGHGPKTSVGEEKRTNPFVKAV